MCGRYVSPDVAAIERAWHIGRHNTEPFARRFNVSPTMMVPMLSLDSGELALTTARWGLIPHWWQQDKPPKFTINARIEEAASKPMWRDALRHMRCLIPAEGWYEWQQLESADRATGEIKVLKQPHYIRRQDGELFCFAGLMSVWSKRGSPAPLVSCAILTTAAAGPLAEIHERMPVVLPDPLHAQWLDRMSIEPEKISAAAHDRAALGEFTHYPVRKLVNSSRNEGPELIEPDDRS